jgi:2-desacetyl-2-hydroxyethyl bacteriochlorophyllide A dehydrogenase
VRVTHVGVCGSDISALDGLHPYIDFPIVLGHEVSGVVDELGEGVEGLEPGQEVAVIPHLVCSVCAACQAQRYNYCEDLRVIGAQADGAHAEYVVMPQEMIVPLPPGATLEDAALVEPAAVAYHGVRRAIEAGDLVYIAGVGAIGMFALQCARHLGARAVYVGDMDPDRLELAAQLGADGVIDLRSESTEAGLERLVGDTKAVDLWVDCVGHEGRALDEAIRLARRGSRVLVVGVLGSPYQVPHLPDFVEHELTLYGTTMYVPDDYAQVLAAMGEGAIRTAGMVTHHYRLDQVAEAFEMITGRQEKFFKIIFEA